MKTETMNISTFRRDMNYKELRELENILLIEEFTNRPVVAVLPYRTFLKMQYLIIKASEGGE